MQRRLSGSMRAMPIDVTIVVEIIAFVLLLCASAFFSSSETSLFSISDRQLAQLRSEGGQRGDRIALLLSKPRRLIITILIGNELVNVSASVLSAAVVIGLLGDEYKWVNLFIMVPMLLLFGEITPKTLAIRNNVAFATFQARPIAMFATAITPVRWLVRRVSEQFITLLVGSERSRGNIITEDMVIALAREAVGEGVLDPVEAQYIEHVFDFGDTQVGELMTPRAGVAFLSSDVAPGELVETLREMRHTKLPVYSGTRDTIEGILFSRDLLGVDPAELAAGTFDFRTVLREPYFVPESKKAGELFLTFRRRRMSVALTVDEYGGVTGLVTTEDLLERIFGDIRSASDPTEALIFEELDGQRYRLDGMATPAAINRKLGAKLDEDGPDTLGGLLLHALGELPVSGGVVKLGGLIFTIARVDENRVAEVIAEWPQKPKAPEVVGDATAEADEVAR